MHIINPVLISPHVVISRSTRLIELALLVLVWIRVLRIVMSLPTVLTTHRLLWLPIVVVLAMLTGPRLRAVSIVVSHVFLLVIIREAILLLYWGQRRCLRLQGNPLRLERRSVLGFLLFLLPLLLLLSLLEVHVEIDEGIEAHLLILLILRKFLRLVLLLLSRLLSLGCRLRKLCLGMHLLHLCKVRVPKLVKPIDELAFFWVHLHEITEQDLRMQSATWICKFDMRHPVDCPLLEDGKSRPIVVDVGFQYSHWRFGREVT